MAIKLRDNYHKLALQLKAQLQANLISKQQFHTVICFLIDLQKEENERNRKDLKSV